jgi:hypothetical protein
MTYDEGRPQRVRLTTSNWVAIVLMMAGQFFVAVGAIWSFTTSVDSRLSTLEARGDGLAAQIAELRADMRVLGREEGEPPLTLPPRRPKP